MTKTAISENNNAANSAHIDCAIDARAAVIARGGAGETNDAAREIGRERIENRRLRKRAQPSHLPFGEPHRGARDILFHLRRVVADGEPARDFAAAERAQRRRFRAQIPIANKIIDLRDQAAREHLAGAAADSFAQHLAPGGVGGQQRAHRRRDIGGRGRHRAPTRKRDFAGVKNFERAPDARLVAQRKARRRFGIDRGQSRMRRGRAFGLDLPSRAGAAFVVDRRRRAKPASQRVEIHHRPSDQQRQSPARRNPPRRIKAIGEKTTDIVFFVGIDDID